MSFGRWLAGQQYRIGWLGDLARAAKKDARFPRAGEPLDMQARIRSILGNTDMPYALGAALDEWYSAPYPIHLDRLARNDAARAAQSQRWRLVTPRSLSDGASARPLQQRFTGQPIKPMLKPTAVERAYERARIRGCVTRHDLEKALQAEGHDDVEQHLRSDALGSASLIYT